MYKIKQLLEDFLVSEISNVHIKKTGKYTIFKLTKKNYTTEKAIQLLAKLFKTRRKSLGYAGNKDRNAVTSQYCSVAGKIQDFVTKDLKVEVVGYSDTPISLGDLKANHFEITVRDIFSRPKKITFVENYFDEQRFSSNNVEIGRKIIKKDFKIASSLIDNDEVREHLIEYPNDYVGAIKKLPFRNQTIYLNAFQSYLWNLVASKFILQKNMECSKVKYSQGEFVFAEKKPLNISIPLISFDTEFQNKDIEKYTMQLLKEEGICQRDFVIRALPHLTPRGSQRDLIVDITDLSISKLMDDELNKGKKKLKLRFGLHKGSYATIVIKKMFNT